MLVALGAYMLIFGRKHFTRVLKLFSALFTTTVFTCLMSINGLIEDKIADGPTGGIVFFIVLTISLGLGLGFFIGSKISHKHGLIFMSIVNSLILSLLIYAFLMTFTGTWVVLMLSCLILLAVCFYLPLKFEK